MLVSLSCCYASTAAVKSLQSCPTVCDPMDCSLPGSSIHGIFQTTVLEWGAIAFSRAVVMGYHKLGVLNNRKELSWFWRPECGIKVQAGLIPSRAERRLFQVSFLVSHGLEMHHTELLLHLYVASYLCACPSLCPDCSCLQGDEPYWIRAHPNNLILI